jgi:hypothetical protein
MTEIRISTLKGGTIALSNDILTALRSELHGNLCLPGEAGYDDARTIWNAMIDRRPGAVVRCRGASDVISAVRLARDNGLLVAVRGGGHNIAGNAVCEGTEHESKTLARSFGAIRVGGKISMIGGLSGPALSALSSLQHPRRLSDTPYSKKTRTDGGVDLLVASSINEIAAARMPAQGRGLCRGHSNVGKSLRV